MTAPLSTEGRAAFEAWLQAEHGLDAGEWQEERHCYRSFHIHITYKAWQAGQRAVQADPGTTHAAGCWDWGYKHYSCALKENGRLHDEMAHLREVLKELSDMYASAWDRADGALVMLPDRIHQFEEAHKQARIALGTPWLGDEESSDE